MELTHKTAVVTGAGRGIGAAIAGVFPLGELGECTDEDFEKAVNLNVLGTFLAAREAIKRMKAGDRIINIGSIFGERMPLYGVGLCAMSKSAVTSFTRAWARDLGPKGITVNCIQPGLIDTELNPADGEFAPPNRTDNGARSLWQGR